MSVLSVNHKLAWSPWRSEKGIRSPGIKLQIVVSCQVGAGIKCSSSGKATSVLNYKGYVILYLLDST